MISERTITSYSKSVTALSDTPSEDGVTAQQLKTIFDSRTDNEIKTAINGLITDLSATTDSKSGADNIGATAITTGGAETVQGILEEFSTTMVEKEAGKGLSSNNFTNSYKNKVDLAEQYQHEHSNKSLLDSYDQTNTNLANCVEKMHEHSNKALLDTYTQSEASIARAVNKAHEHSNFALLERLSVATALVDDENTIPTSKAVKEALDLLKAEIIAELRA